MNYVSQIVFSLVLIAGIGYFAANVKRLIRNIRLGRAIDRTDQKSERWKTMILIALGNKKWWYVLLQGYYISSFMSVLSSSILKLLKLLLMVFLAPIECLVF